jgi:hypothetical protein
MAHSLPRISKAGSILFRSPKPVLLREENGRSSYEISTKDMPNGIFKSSRKTREEINFNFVSQDKINIKRTERVRGSSLRSVLGHSSIQDSPRSSRLSPPYIKVPSY